MNVGAGLVCCGIERPAFNEDNRTKRLVWLLGWTDVKELKLLDMCVVQLFRASMVRLCLVKPICCEFYRCVQNFL